MKSIGRVMQPFSAHHLMTLFICTKLQENISKVSELISTHILKFSKGHNSIKNVGGVMVLVLFILFDSVLYLYYDLSKYLIGFQSYGSEQ